MIRIGCSRWHSHNDERGNSSPTVTQSQKYRYSKSGASRAGIADTFMVKASPKRKGYGWASNLYLEAELFQQIT
jgi:hypothetical protein